MSTIRMQQEINALKNTAEMQKSKIEQMEGQIQDLESLVNELYTYTGKDDESTKEPSKRGRKTKDS